MPAPDLKAVLNRNQDRSADSQTAAYVQPRGPGLHQVRLIPQDILVLATGRVAFQPGEVVTLVMPRGGRFWVIVEQPPPGKGGASVSPVLESSYTLPLPVDTKRYWGVWSNDGDDVHFDQYDGDGALVSTNRVVQGSGIMTAIDAAGGRLHSFPFKSRDAALHFLWVNQYFTLVFCDATSGDVFTYDSDTVAGDQLHIFAPTFRRVDGDWWIYWVEAASGEGTAEEHSTRPDPLRLMRCPYKPEVDFSQAQVVSERNDFGSTPTPSDRKLWAVAWSEFYCYTWHFGTLGVSEVQTGLPLIPDAPSLFPQTTCESTTINVDRVSGLAYRVPLTTVRQVGVGGDSGGALLLEMHDPTAAVDLGYFLDGCADTEGFVKRGAPTVAATNVDFTERGAQILAYNNNTGVVSVGSSLRDDNIFYHGTTLDGNPESVHANRPNGYPDWVFLTWFDDDLYIA